MRRSRSKFYDQRHLLCQRRLSLERLCPFIGPRDSFYGQASDFMGRRVSYAPGYTLRVLPATQRPIGHKLARPFLLSAVLASLELFRR